METDGTQLLVQLENFSSLTWEQQAAWCRHAAHWRTAPREEVENLLEVLTELAAEEPEGRWQRAFDSVLPELSRRFGTINEQQLSGQLADRLAALYRQLEGRRQTRAHLLRMFSSDAHPDALRMLAELMATDPPEDPRDGDLALVPLVQNEELDPAPLYPRLLAAVAHPAAAVQVLDVTNHLFRRGLLKEHPGQARLAEWIQLTTAVATQLEHMQQAGPDETDPAKLSQLVGDSVSLLVALCDTLALIGDPQATSALRKVVALRHRRVRTEAAAALCRLGDDEGIDPLLEMVEEPSMRNRALKYLSELGRMELVEERYRTGAAQAESDMATYLASPAQFGAAPHQLDLIDERRMSWPGFHEPVDCYLFGFEYHLPQGELHGVGLAGPFCFSLPSDLQDLSPEDLYAVYAGWSVQHDQIKEFELSKIPSDRQGLVEIQRQELEDVGYENVRVLKVGQFFDETVIVAGAEIAGDTGMVVAGHDTISWHPMTEGKPTLGANEAYWLYLGRKLLAAFNPAGLSADAADAHDSLT